MKLLSTLKRFPAENCFILTYNIDLAFFEYMLFAPLYLSGCRNVVILCDPTQYELALQDMSILRFAGQRYLLLPSGTSPGGAFHPKLILLTNRDAGSAIVTSANLTRSGYTHNWEVAYHFQYSDHLPDTISLEIFHWSCRVFDELIRKSDPSGIARKRLDQLYGTTPWLRAAPAGELGGRTWAIHSLEAPLLDQFLRIYGDNDDTKVKHISIVSPYFDHKLKALNELVARLQPNEVRIWSKDPQGLDPRALAKLESEFNVALGLKYLDCENRSLHAKAVVLSTDKGAWSIAGSANMSAPAWLKPASKGNTEIVVIRFEPDPDYFGEWLEEIAQTGRSIEIDSIEFKPATDWPTKNGRDRRLQIVTAIVDDSELTITLGMEDTSNGEAALILDVPGGPRVIQVQLSELERELKVHLDNRMLQLVESPSGCWLEQLSADGDTLRSNLVVITNLNSLRRFARPLAKKDRPQIPKGLRPESYEQCLELLGMLEDLFAKNQGELERHRGRIGKRQRDVEKRMVVEEEGEYIAADHFVEEPVRAPYLTAGEQLYADYYDRLTYEELLKFVLKVVYRPLSEARPDPMQTDIDEVVESELERPRPAEDIDDDTRRKLIARIEGRFGNLVRNLVLGMKDDEYLEEVPPLYLLEIFIVVVSFLKIVWLDEFLSTARFQTLSYDLLVALWGWPGEEGAWHQIRPRMSDAELRDAEERLGVSATVWILVYLLSFLAEKDRRGYYDLAAWVRHGLNQLQPPHFLRNLGDGEFTRLRRSTFPKGLGEITPSEIVATLGSLAHQYDEHTLVAEIISDPSSRATIELKTVADIANVPALLARMALSDEALNQCFEHFKIFLMNPVPKDNAWAQFTNVNPPGSANEISKVIMFYRGRDKSFEFVTQREAPGDYRPDISLRNLNRRRLLECQGTEEIMELAKGGDPEVTQA